MKIKLLAQDVPVADIVRNIEAHPEFWNEYTARTQHPDSPHHGLSDIWARFASPETEDKASPHVAQWYPSAEILGIKPVIEGMMQTFGGVELGGVLITKIPPGVNCRPHVDHGWHARTYEKFALQLKANKGQCFHFEGEQLVSRPGDIFWFDNAHTHWVTNPTNEDRITMIVCMRTKEI